MQQKPLPSAAEQPSIVNADIGQQDRLGLSAHFDALAKLLRAQDELRALVGQLEIESSDQTRSS